LDTGSNPVYSIEKRPFTGRFSFGKFWKIQSDMEERGSVMEHRQTVTYEIMHLDRRVASVDTAGRSRVYFRSFLPYNLFLEEEQDIDTLVNNLTNFYYWCSSRVLTLGDCTVNLQDAAVRRADGTTLALTATERALLQRLADDRGHIVTYDAVCEAVWGADYYGYENSLNVHIRHLREKIEPDPGHPQWLLTVRGIGYRLTGEV